IYGDFGFLLEAIQSVGKRRCSRLINDSLDGEASQFARFLGRITLSVIEISWNGDYCARNFVAEEIFGVPLQFFEHFSGKFFRSRLMGMNIDGQGPSACRSYGKRHGLVLFRYGSTA